MALLKQHEIRGNMAVPFDWGEYVLWHLGPAIKVSIDGRRETIYSDETYQQSRNFERGTGVWDALLKNATTDLVLVSNGSPTANLLSLKADWVPLYRDNFCILFVREGFPGIEHLAQSRIPDLPDDGGRLCFPAQVGQTDVRPPVRFRGQLSDSSRIGQERQERMAMAPRELERIWDEHLAGEFTTKDVEATLATMVDDASVDHIPVHTGGRGKDALRAFYRDVFIPSWPDDLEQIPTNRVVGDGQIVDEIRTRFTHDRPMEWFLPGVPPTHKVVDIDIIVVVQFRGDKIACERIYWDQATVLRQVGLLDH